MDLDSKNSNDNEKISFFNKDKNEYTITSKNGISNQYPNNKTLISSNNYGETSFITPLFEIIMLKTIIPPENELCLICCSLGDLNDIIFCADCGECYHTFCLTPPLDKKFIKPSIYEWRCPNCKYCEYCNSYNDEDKLIICDKCDRCYHSFCLNPYEQPYDDSDVWICSDCVICNECGSKEPGKSLSSKWRYGYTLCMDCGDKKDMENKRKEEMILLDIINVNLSHYKTINDHRRDVLDKINEEMVNMNTIDKLDKPISNFTVNDPRICGYCNERNDYTIRGRLIPYKNDGWVHINCCKWSDEVIEYENGLLQNVSRSIKKSKSTKCSFCKLIGASIPCYHGQCNKMFHFICLIKANSKIYIDEKDKITKYTFCNKHAVFSTIINSNEPLYCFDPSTRLYQSKISLYKVDKCISIEKPVHRRKKKKFNDEEKYRVGSLTVHSLGKISTSPFFHNESFIYPMEYEASRIYWSWKVDNNDNRINGYPRRCVYKMTILERNKKPLYRIQCMDDPDNIIESLTDKEAWDEVIRRVNECQSILNIKMRSKLGNIGSDYLFGFGCSSIMKNIERLPNARSQKNFKFKYDMKIRIPLSLWRAALYNLSSNNENILLETEVPLNESGCARTEVFKKKSSSEKIKYADAYGFHPSTAKYFMDKEQIDYLMKSKPIMDTKVDLPVQMMYRNMKRLEKISLKILRSRIHEWGVFTTIPINENEMIIEYVGEIIRQKVADIREKYYEAMNIGCYMFRIDDNFIIDATRKGNKARFINHSCDPNSATKIIEINGVKKIIIYAIRKISQGEEITYDYKFPYEEKKIKCNCGASNCRGTMN